MSDNKIIPFPTNRILDHTKVGPTDKNSDRIAKKNVEKQTKEFIEGNIDEMAIGMLQRLVDMGVRTNKETFTKDLALVIESLRGLLYRDFDMKHPAQTLVDTTVNLKMNKSGSASAQIDYSKILKGKQTTKPLSKDIKNELDDLQQGASDFFEPDIDLDD